MLLRKSTEEISPRRDIIDKSRTAKKPPTATAKDKGKSIVCCVEAGDRSKRAVLSHLELGLLITLWKRNISADVLSIG
jgi:hypothetical protein